MKYVTEKSLLSGLMTDRYHRHRKKNRKQQMTLNMLNESIKFSDIMKDETVSQNCSNPPFFIVKMLLFKKDSSLYSPNQIFRSVP